MKRTVFWVAPVLTLALMAGCAADSRTGGSRHAYTEGAMADRLSDLGEAPAGGAAGQAPVSVRPGLLTAGEWNDNKNFDFMRDLAQTHEGWKTFEERWQFNATNRIQVVVLDEETPVVNARVELLDENEQPIFSAQTDNNGVAYVFENLGLENDARAAFIRATASGSETRAIDPQATRYEFTLSGPRPPKRLDLMLVVDTTGSMSDELSFLQTELSHVIRRVTEENANLPIRLSINVYRDIGDDYVVRSRPFEENIDGQMAFLHAQSAGGGGDFEEAVELALADAIEEHDWNEEATAKILLLVLDAPPHHTEAIRAEMHRLAAAAAGKGIRILPVASSGVDKHTEFLLRCLSVVTGGTYVFLTDHSGIGNAHLEPTIGDYQVELLSDLLVRLLNEYMQ